MPIFKQSAGKTLRLLARCA